MKLKFNDGKFRILMIADTQEGKKVNSDTINLIKAALDRTQPDFVVFSGDQIWKKTSFKGDVELVRNALTQITQPVVDREINFTICFGNHDHQTGVSREEQWEIYKSFKGFVDESVDEIDGVGNECIPVYDGDDIKYLIYLFDSHSNLKVGYDSLHQNQIEWYKTTRDSFEKINGSVIPGVVFQHIPIIEVFEFLKQVKKTTRHSVRGFRDHDGEYFVLKKEMVNEGAFMKESPAAPAEQCGEFDALKEKGDIKGIYFGHDHNNSFHGELDGIDVGYTQGCGFGIYGPGLDRGVRVVDLFVDGHLETHDLRYKNLVGKNVENKLNYIIMQLCPTNLFDAASRIAKAFGVIAIIAIIALILTTLL